VSDSSNTTLREPSQPFYFNTSEHLLRIGRERAGTLSELLNAIRRCPADSIFQHTFRTLQEHHFIRQGFSNDFAHWTLSACREPALAEQLARIDVLEFTSIEDLRGRISAVVADFLQAHPTTEGRRAREPFCFCVSDIVVLPTRFVSKSLTAFVTGVRKVPLHSIHHHFIEARLRLKRMSNDFSHWLEREMGLQQAAQAIERIDIYNNTLESVRAQIATIVENAQG
jgi:hypothetical protein